MSGIGHIGINAVFLQPRMGGLETYVRQLVPRLVELLPETRFSVFCNSEGARYLRKDSWSSEVDLVTHPLLGRRYLRALTELTLLGKLADDCGVELLHSVAMTGPLRMRAVHVLTVADLIWLHHPEATGRPTATLWRLTVPAVARRADRLLTFSEATRTDLVESLAVPLGKVDVVPLGHGIEGAVEPTSADELRESLELGEGPVILTVSAKRPHKNLARLIEAMVRIRARTPAAMLVMPGNPTRHEAELKRLAAARGVAQAVRFPAYVDAADLEGLYRLASCFVYPSLREGFGLPLLEAMRRGVPVACSNVSSLPEAAGEAARYFNPKDVDEIAGAVVELLEDRSQAARLVAAGRERGKRFTWTAAAEGTAETYERAWAAKAGR